MESFVLLADKRDILELEVCKTDASDIELVYP